MLVDELLSVKRGPIIEIMRGGMGRFQKDLREAQHFVLDPTITRSADAMQREEVLRVVEFCRVPFPLTWVEFAHGDRPGFGITPVQENEAVPSRVGVLAERTSQNPEVVSATLCWTNKLYGPNICPITMEISPANVSATAGRHPISGRYGWLAPHYLSKYFKEMTVLAHNEHSARAAAEKLQKQGLSDWSGEDWFWLAVLALLNAKNAASSEAVSHEKLNRVRHRMGRPPLIDYHLLKLRLDRSAQRALSSEAGTAEPVRAHVVRGHFKVRKTGIYWWAPHVRGDLAHGFAAKRYQVAT